MARIRNKKSTLSYGGYGLKPQEDREFLRLLQRDKFKAKEIVRVLIRQWIKEDGPGIISFIQMSNPKIYKGAKN